MSKVMSKFRSKQVDSEVVDTLLNSPELPELTTTEEQQAPAPAEEFSPVEDFEFIRERDEKRLVDKFIRFLNDKDSFIGRFLEVWGEDSLTQAGENVPFQGVVFTEGNETQSLNSDVCLLPSHSQLVDYFTSKGVVGMLYKIERVEKVELKGGRSFVKFNIYTSNK